MDCARCDGICCKSYVVPITSYDVARIARLGYDPSCFVDFTPVGDIQSDYGDMRLGDTYHYMILKRLETGVCFFAVENSGRLSCSIHENSPLTCRIYPLSPSTGRTRKRHLCGKSQATTAREANAGKEELKEAKAYNEKVRMWNAKKTPGNARDYISYILEP